MFFFSAKRFKWEQNTNWTFFDTFGLNETGSTGICEMIGVVGITGVCGASRLGCESFLVAPGDFSAGITSCSVADFRKITSKAERSRFSAAVIVEYGVADGLVFISGAKCRKLNELVFFRIDFRGYDPKFGLFVESLFLRP